VRPSYSRANSNLQSVKERPHEQKSRPVPVTLTSHEGIDDAGIEETLLDPPTEIRPEARPEVSADDRYEETRSISNDIREQKDPFAAQIHSTLQPLKEGETKRQKSQADAVTKSQAKDDSDDRKTLLLVEDNLINQKVLRRQLQSRGFEVSSRKFSVRF
jgi:hypothetical protein